MKGQLGNIMKQAQAMQENMQKAQEELANTEVTGQSGAGLVEVVMTCRHDVTKVSIDPELMQDDCTAENLAAEVGRYLDDETAVVKVKEAFLKISFLNMQNKIEEIFME